MPSQSVCRTAIGAHSHQRSGGGDDDGVLVTAGSGDLPHRTGLPRDQATVRPDVASAGDCQWDWKRCPPAERGLGGDGARGRCQRRVRAAYRRGRTSRTSPSARSGGPGRRCPRPRWCAENWPGTQGGGGRAVQGEGRRDLLEHDYPGPGRSGGRPEEVTSSISCSRWKEMGMAIRHCRPGAS